MAPHQRQTRSGLMSQLGQNRKCPRLHGMSVLPSRADIVRLPRHVRFVPMSDIAMPKSVIRSEITLGKLGIGSFHRIGHGRIRSVTVRFAIEIGALQVMLQSRLFVRL
jgi:hypothetical protein